MVCIFPSFPTRSALFCMTLLTDARELLMMEVCLLHCVSETTKKGWVQGDLAAVVCVTDEGVGRGKPVEGGG